MRPAHKVFVAYTLQMRLPPADKLTGASSAMLVLLLLPLLLLQSVCHPCEYGIGKQQRTRLIG
jgi:hypothetical protein